MVSFKHVSSTKASNLIPVNKYKSDKTGLTVIIADVEGPVVNGYFCLATEAHDDDGLPHTLEHLIFLGSERYPFKGILDLLANRCLAAGTNAWTDTDHTCYTVRTAGAAGMLSLLPIYLDHILRPTLTEHGYVTEVHHIDGDGLDAGVVYCEMQGRENSAHSRCQLTLLRSMYPNSGYSSETGGIMKNLRVSTNNQKVRDFHKKFYRAENMCIILTGQIEAEKVFEALEIVESDIIEKRNSIEQNEEWVRPWQSIPPPPNYDEIKVQWPADIEDCGEVWFGWRGPNLTAIEGLKDLSGCAVMLRYLCETPTAPMQRELVERDDALAGDVTFSVIENIIAEIQIVVENVPIDKMEQASKKAKEVLANIRSGEESIDMERVERLVRKQLRECIAQLEAKPHDVIAFQCIGDMLYSQNEEQFRNRLNPEKILRELLKEPASYWQGLLKRFFTEKYVSIFGTPSIDLQTKMADEEEERIQLQKEKLGADGLVEKAKILNNAMEFNERPPLPGTLANVPIPSCQDLKRHNISNWSSDSKESCPYLELSKLPLYARVHSLKTNFVYITLLLDMNDVPEDVRKWLPLLLNAFTESPLRRGDTLVSHTDIVAEIERHTVQIGTRIGQEREGNFVIGSYGNTATFFVQCEPSEYNKVVELLWELLYATELTRERLTVIAQRLVNEVSQVRRNSNKMASDLLRDALYMPDSNLHWCSALRQHRFLSALLARLAAGESEAMLLEASQARSAIVGNAWLHLAGNLEGEKLDTEPWIRFGNENEIVPKSPIIKWDSELISCNGGGGSVVGLGGVESNFLVQSSPGPLGFQHPDLAPLLLAIQYFTQLEGPMWRLIRGAGLSYGYNIIALPQEGRVVLSLYRATNPLAAYTKAKSIVEEFLSGGELDQELFESAKSSLLFEVIDQENSPADIVQQSLLFFFKKVNDTYNRDLVYAIENVTVEKAREAAARWLPNVFKADETKMSIICHPSKVKETCEAFKKVGCELEGFESLEASHFNK